MRVSIVTVCFNSAATIEDTIQSVCDQEYDDLEHIIVDGGSTDGTQDVIRRHNGRIKKFISEPDRGIYDAMNKGLALAAGEVVAFLNADDVYASSAVIGDVTAAGDNTFTGTNTFKGTVNFQKSDATPIAIIPADPPTIDGQLLLGSTSGSMSWVVSTNGCVVRLQ
jgi:glycosyltransferase involved in cell wall biosynthesis